MGRMPALRKSYQAKKYLDTLVLWARILYAVAILVFSAEGASLLKPA